MCATHEVVQDYVITTFDLDESLSPCLESASEIRHIKLIGTFHLTSAYLKVIGKEMDGSGSSDILEEAVIISSGSSRLGNIMIVLYTDFELYVQCILVMPALLFIFGGQNYAIYLIFFGLFISNNKVSYPCFTELLKRGIFSVAREIDVLWTR